MVQPSGRPVLEIQILNEQTKLLSTALNTAAPSCLTVGIATPVAGYGYNVGYLRGTLSFPVLLLGIFGRLGAAVGLHYLARRVLRGRKG